MPEHKYLTDFDVTDGEARLITGMMEAVTKTIGHHLGRTGRTWEMCLFVDGESHAVFRTAAGRTGTES